MTARSGARQQLLDRVVGYAAESGVAGRSLREIAAAVGTSHRMLIYHFGSHEGLLAAIVAVVEEQQRATLTALSASGRAPREVMLELWGRVSSPDLRPFVRLFFEVFGLAVRRTPGTEALLATLTAPWLEDGVAAAATLGVPADAAAMRLGVAVSRGLLLDLLAGADPAEVDAAYTRFVELYERAG